MQTFTTFLKLLTGLVCILIAVVFLGWYTLIPVVIGVLWHLAAQDTKRKQASAKQGFNT